MTLVAMPREYRLNILYEIHLPRGRLWQIPDFGFRISDFVTSFGPTQCQSLRPLRSLIDPRPQNAHLFLRQRFALAHRGHLRILNQPCREMNQRTLGALPWNNILPILAAFERMFVRVQQQLSLCLFGPVTFEARPL